MTKNDPCSEYTDFSQNSMKFSKIARFKVQNSRLKKLFCCELAQTFITAPEYIYINQLIINNILNEESTGSLAALMMSLVTL